MTTWACDVVVAGGGPGGCATALSLRRHAPELSVVLVEPSRFDEARIGETLSSIARRMLAHLGVWDVFERQGHREVHGSVALWGTPDAYENDFIFSSKGAGWHLDRSRFDAMLAERAEVTGVRLLRETRVDRVDPDSDGWRIRLSNGGALRARFVVDATGRRALVVRSFGTRVLSVDRLAGFARFFDGPPDGDPRTIVEAFEDGWWYTAGLPDGRRVAACMTDVDLARRYRLKEPECWRRLLDTTTRVRETVGEAVPCSPMVIRATESRYLDPACGPGWLAVGDAASMFDPLSSQGIAKALRSGIFASYAIADLLLEGDDEGLVRYRRYVRDEFEEYARIRTRFYREERRWPKSEFWRRRWDESEVRQCLARPSVPNRQRPQTGMHRGGGSR